MVKRRKVRMLVVRKVLDASRQRLGRQGVGSVAEKSPFWYFWSGSCKDAREIPRLILGLGEAYMRQKVEDMINRFHQKVEVGSRGLMGMKIEEVGGWKEVRPRTRSSLSRFELAPLLQRVLRVFTPHIPKYIIQS